MIKKNKPTVSKIQPFGMLDMDFPHHKPSFSKKVDLFVPGFGKVEYALVAGEPVLVKRKIKKAVVKPVVKKKAAAAPKPPRASKPIIIPKTKRDVSPIVPKAKKPAVPLFKAADRLRRDMYKSLVAIQRIQYGEDPELDPFNHIGTPVVKAEKTPEFRTPLDEGIEFEVPVPKSRGPVLETLAMANEALDAKNRVGARIHVDEREPKVRSGTNADLAIQYENEMTDLQRSAGVTNGVEIDERELKRMRRKIKSRTNKVRDFLTERTTPMLMSYDAGAQLTQVMLRDGLGVDVTFDQDVGAIIADLAKLELSFFYVKNLRMPKTVKQHYMTKLTDSLIAHTMNEIDKGNKAKAVRSELEGYVKLARSNKAARAGQVNRTAPDHESALEKLNAQVGAQQRAGRIGVKGSRSPKGF